VASFEKTVPFHNSAIDAVGPYGLPPNNKPAEAVPIPTQPCNVELGPAGFDVQFVPS